MNLEQIDTSTTAGKAEVMRLAAEGRRVAYSTRGLNYSESEFPSWNWHEYDYAIISEPVGPEEVWISFNNGGFVCGTSRTPYRGYELYIRADLAGEKG
jgi:hypothetical protein